MVKHTYLLDTCICNFIMREQLPAVLDRLQSAIMQQHRMVISAITYAEMRYGTIGKKASPKHTLLVDAFVARLDAILPWGAAAVDQTIVIKQDLTRAGTPIGANDAAIAGHAMAENCTVVTNNTREFQRVEGLRLEDWVN